MSGNTVHILPTAELSATELYRLLALRSQVFVVEQNCVYLDPDGLDLQPATRQLWISDSDDEVLATCRVLRDAQSWWIGRVATAKRARSAGLAAELVRSAVHYASEGGDPSQIRLNGQSHLEGWYERLGFVRDGEPYLEDGIPHVPMRLHR